MNKNITDKHEILTFMAEYDFLAKILILGDAGVGKTHLWNRYCDIHIGPEYTLTIGIEFKTRTIDINGKRVKLQIWDTCGQERFRAVSRSYYRGAHGVLLCYDINCLESFKNIEPWLKEVKEYATEKDIWTILVGTKSDLSNKRVVSHDEGRKLTEKHGMRFFETSAKENANIDELFLAIAKDIKEVLNKKKDETQEATSTQLYQSKSNPQAQINCFNCS